VVEYSGLVPPIHQSFDEYVDLYSERRLGTRLELLVGMAWRRAGHPIWVQVGEDVE
jgi:hypothetical protein